MTKIEIAMQQLAAYQGQIVEAAVMSQILNDLITEHAARRGEMIDLHNRYKVDQGTVPVFFRKFEDTNKINRKLNNSFDSEIVDTKCGYMFGRPVVYSIDRTEYQDEAGAWTNKAGWDKQQAIIDEFNARNMIEDLDAETGKLAAICGVAARLCYIDREGKERLMNVLPWECIWVHDMSINEPQYALRYYPVQTREDGAWVERTRVEWYDDTNVTFYLAGKDGMYALDTDPKKYDPTLEEWVADNPKRHMFTFIPLLAFPNNEEAQGDGEKVLPLIDSYDYAISDQASEYEQLRLSYMAFYGSNPDAETLLKAKKTGAFGMPPGNESRIEFITKEINSDAIEKHLDRVDDNILRFSKSVNFADEEFSGNASGVAMKFKLFNLENKCMMMERKFIRSLQQQFKVICSAWAQKGITFAPKPEDSYLNIFFEFSRNFPLNLLEEAQTSLALKGLVSEPTRLALLSFIDDPAYELQLMQAEAEEAMAVQQEMFAAEAEITAQNSGGSEGGRPE